ncbi:MAG TPA: D-2-hydroxyacid dehydrogenase, partial [Chloroflexi bacterium]|nr:D-2-hydroxyacid dehydrogenase [Chloroflexota bacterium]
MKIVVLDGYTLNPGDLTWEGLEALGEVTVYDRSDPDQVVERAKDADIVLVNKVKLPRDVMDQLPKLKFVAVLATG